MYIEFHKYQGTGNDFIMLDNRDGIYNFLTTEHIRFLCDRRFGIGADGLICINAHDHYAFEVDYSNSDGSKSFCGNGARCAVAFAETLGINCSSVTFLAIDGEHQAKIDGELISIQMQNVLEVQAIGADFELNTGSPHYIRFTEVLKEHDIVAFGKEIRYSAKYDANGINVNLVHREGNKLFVETYERGVEDETLSCGTGVTAAAIVAAYKDGESGGTEISIEEAAALAANPDTAAAVVELSPKVRRHFDIEVKGGSLSVTFQHELPQTFTDIWLKGPAKLSFKGGIDV